MIRSKVENDLLKQSNFFSIDQFVPQIPESAHPVTSDPSKEVLQDQDDPRARTAQTKHAPARHIKQLHQDSLPFAYYVQHNRVGVYLLREIVVSCKNACLCQLRALASSCNELTPLGNFQQVGVLAERRFLQKSSLLLSSMHPLQASPHDFYICCTLNIIPSNFTLFSAVSM